MAEARKKAAELVAKNLAQLQKIDIAASKILDTVSFAAIYSLDVTKKTWEKSGCEGTFFLYQRADRPYFSFLIANRNDPSDFIEPLTINHLFRLDHNFIFFYKESTKVQGLWFSDHQDTSRVHHLLHKLVEKLKGSTTEQARAAAAKASAAVPTTAPVTAQPSSKSIDLLQMIKGAQQSSSSTAATAVPAPPSVVAPEAQDSPPSVTTMPVLLQKLMVQEQPRSMLKEPGTAMSADELEKDLLKSAKPRHHLLQDFANSPSAISLAAISTKSVHGSEGDPEADVAEGEILEPLETSFVVGSGVSTPVLNKEQFLSAMVHLMQSDDEFVAQIHQAYIEALNRRLNLN